ncbi:MAG: PfkB family carbohydrate kinase [Acidobacteriota bacterium]|nr:PfkB family carbohydrate kinase [Acidobacteriota bacterium]
MAEAPSKIVSVDELVAIRARLRAAGKTVVQCHGCFDIVHPGHIRYLKFAKSLGDVLVVSVSSDRVVDKGEERPYITEELRLENLAVLEFVDHVCLDDNDWAGPILERVQPDVYVKGKEYETKGHPQFARERELVEAYGGRVVFSSGDVIYSSTFILSQFRESFRLERERLAFFCRSKEIDSASLDALIRSFRGRRVLVLGDPVLDEYIHCEALGIASEAPVLSVTPIRKDWYAGAAALIAAQIVELGGRASMLVNLSPGPSTDRFRSIAAQTGIELIDSEDAERPVATKTRYVVEDRKVFKVDNVRPLPSSAGASRTIAGELRTILGDYDGLIVTDFGYGFFTQPLIDVIEDVASATGKPYYLDVSHTRRANILRFRGARIATPTEHELRFAFADNEAGLSHLASRFFRQTGAEHLLLTMGPRGVLLCRRPSSPEKRVATDFLPALESTAVDPVGAGDVFLAGVSLTDLAGGSCEMGAYLGSALAALHVSTLGNRAVDERVLLEYLEHRPELQR